MKSKFIVLPLTFILASSACAVTFAWRGNTSSDWTTDSNWEITGTPIPTPPRPVPGTTYPADTFTVNNWAYVGDAKVFYNAAVYSPGAGVTTTFGGGRCFVIGVGNGPAATPPQISGKADLTVTSGTIAAVRPTAADGNEPFMANRTNSTLLINGGAVDLTNINGKEFRLIQEGLKDSLSDEVITSTITISSGSLACNLLNLYYDSEADPTTAWGNGVINLEGTGVLALNRFNRSHLADPGQTSFKINLNGGTLRARNTNANFLNDLADTDTIVKIGGAKIDTNTFNSTITEVLEHDSTLGPTPDGGLTKIGQGNLTLNGANTFDGGLTINAGTALATPSRVILSANDSGGGAGNITLADSYTELQLGLNRNIANPLVVSNTGDEKTLLFVNAGSSQYSGPITINETNIDHFRLRSDVNCFFTLSGKISGAGGIYKYQVGAAYLTDPTNDFTGGAKITQGLLSFTAGALGTTGAITMDGGTLRWDPSNNQDISSRLVMVDGKTATLTLSEQTTPSYDISNVTFLNAIGNSSTAALVKSGPGTLALTQPSTYSGGTTLTQGTLGFPAGGLGTTGSVTMNGGTLRWEAANTDDVSARIVMVNAKTATFSTNGNSVTFATVIGNASTGNLAKSGSGTLTLANTNTYTGSTTINQGNLNINSIKDYGVDSAIGAPAEGDIQLGGGNNFTNLDYTGSGDSTNRTVKLGDATPANTGVGSIRSNGTGPLTFTAANFNPTITGITAARTLWLGGTHTATPNEIQGIIQDNDVTGKVNVGKANDASTWVLSGANTYTGSTIVQGGTLKLGAVASIASSTAVTINAGATLDTSAQTTYTIPGTQSVAFGIDAGGGGSSGKIAAAALNISAAVVTYNIAGTPNDPVYVLATYTSLSGTPNFLTVEAPPAGYVLNYAYEGNKIALVQSAVSSGYDTWKTQITNGLNLRTDDADGDGFNNLQEFLFGTSPIAGNGSLVTTTASGGNLTLRWLQRESGATYTLKESATLAADSWSPSAPQGAIDGDQTGAPTDYDYFSATLPTSGGKLLFRIEGVEN